MDRLCWNFAVFINNRHCFDAIVIRHLPECIGMNWTGTDDMTDYEKLVEAAKLLAKGKSLPSGNWSFGIKANNSFDQTRDSLARFSCRRLWPELVMHFVGER